jgi:hypothetical protein
MKQKHIKIVIKPEEIIQRNPVAFALASARFHQRRIVGRKGAVRGEKHKKGFVQVNRIDHD